MSGSELQRIEVLSEVLARKRTELSAAAVLGLSTRQTRRLTRAYRDGGGGALIKKARGRPSNNQADRRKSASMWSSSSEPATLTSVRPSPPRSCSRKGWREGLARDATQVDDRGRFVAILHKSGHLNFEPTGSVAPK